MFTVISTSEFSQNRPLKPTAAATGIGSIEAACRQAQHDAVCAAFAYPFTALRRLFVAAVESVGQGSGHSSGKTARAGAR